MFIRNITTEILFILGEIKVVLETLQHLQNFLLNSFWAPKKFKKIRSFGKSINFLINI